MSISKENIEIGKKNINKKKTNLIISLDPQLQHSFCCKFIHHVTSIIFLGPVKQIRLNSINFDSHQQALNKFTLIGLLFAIKNLTSQPPNITELKLCSQYPYEIKATQ